MTEFYIKEIYNEIDRCTTEIVIETLPATTNLSGEVKLDGWCGTFNDTATYAHGVYETLEEAQAVVKRMFSDFQACSNRVHFNIFGFDYSDIPSVVRVYKHQDKLEM
ncbi:hypothetical protein [Sulfitobacter sp. SH24]|uniref:hypothetical protein n=1 Tax=Sulfitobacter sp. SH24 TaxID=3421173 RepID=UPI003F4F7C84